MLDLHHNITHTQWWRRLVNAYEVKTGTVYLQRKSCVIHTRALQWFSQRGAIQIFVPLPSHLGLDHTTITQDPPPAQNDTVHSYNMAYPTTSTGFCIDYNYYFITWNVCNVPVLLVLLILILLHCIFYSAIQLYCWEHVNKSSSSLPLHANLLLLILLTPLNGLCFGLRLFVCWSVWNVSRITQEWTIIIFIKLNL